MLTLLRRPAAMLRPASMLATSSQCAVLAAPTAVLSRALQIAPALKSYAPRGPPDRPPKPTWEDPETASREALLQFIDPYEKDPDRGEPGRRWRAAELRLKSNEDLQKLWIVLLRERNMLHSTRMLHKKRKTKMPHLGRVQATRKSMAMIKVVLGERQRAKQERDERLAAEHLRECTLSQIDLARSEVWPPFIPGAARELPLAAAHSFTILLRTTDGSTPEKDPPADALAIEMRYKGELLPSNLVEVRMHRQPPAKSRPDQVRYNCHVYVGGQAIPAADFLRPGSEEELGDPLSLEVSATLYGEPLGEGAVPVRVLPSKRRKRLAALAAINRAMSAKLRERKEAAAKGLEELP